MEKLNVVQKWAKNIKDYADNALCKLDGCGYESGNQAAIYIGQIKGCAEAMLAAAADVEDGTD